MTIISPFSFISAGHIWYFIYHLHSFLSREHMNPQLTCSQCQWLHSSVGRASHRYREVTGSNPVEVLNFFQASLRNCINWFTATTISSFSVLSYVHETSHKVRETSYTEQGFNVSKTARKGVKVRSQRKVMSIDYNIIFKGEP